MGEIIPILRAISFGPFLVLAFVAGLFIFWKKGKDEYYDEHQLFDIFLEAGVWGLVGARLGFIFLHFPEFGFDVLRWLSLTQHPGYIGIIGILFGAMALFRKTTALKWDAYEIADFASLSFTLAITFISIGMFLNGSGFGYPTTWPIGMSFPGVFDLRHPAQLYSAVLFLFLFLLLWRLEQIYRTFLWYRENKRTAQSGFVYAVSCIGYGLIIGGLLFVRPPVIEVYGLPVDAVLASAVAFYGMGILYVRSGRTITVRKRAKQEPIQEPSAIEATSKQA